MGINFDKMRQKQKALQSRDNNGKKFFWKPQDGEQTIRILPDSDGDPFKEFWFHYGIGDETAFLCPKKNHGEECVVCDFVQKLYNTRDEEDRKLANQTRAKQRFFSPVIVRGDEGEGPRLWGYSRTVYEKLLNLVLNPDYGDITDPKEGTDLVMEYGKKAGALFPATELQPRRRSSALSDKAESANEWVSTEFPYATLFPPKTSDEVKVIFENYRNGTSDVEKVETKQYQAQNKESTIESSFKELLAS